MTETSDMSRKVSEEDKLQGNSLPEIRRAWEQATIDLKDEVRDLVRSLRPGNLLNAMVLWCLTQPPERRIEIARWGLRAFEGLKARDEPINLTKTSREDFGKMLGIPDEGIEQKPSGSQGQSTGKAKHRRRGVG